MDVSDKIFKKKKKRNLFVERYILNNFTFKLVRSDQFNKSRLIVLFIDSSISSFIEYDTMFGS